MHPQRHAFQLRELIRAQAPPHPRPAPHLPTEFRTARLLLRAPRPDDAQAQVDAVNASLPELRRWMVWAQEPQTLEGARENLAQAAEAYARRENLRLLVWNAAGTELLGSTGYHSLDWRVPKGEIGYWIATAHTGHGYAQEVAEFLTNYALTDLGFRRVEIRCDARNARSARIPRALDYTLDARLVNDDVAADEPARLRDTLIFSRTR
ncbi:GNAT family N-acetyltransferase [Deinococcus sp. KSM4-11]|nr:GNAT family N-acetyltransferase [Deinococcus sp. KSM4-11]